MPARELPPHADLEFYKGEAKDLLAACKAGDARALDRLQPRHRVQPVLADARFAIAREHDFESWPTFAAHLKGLRHGIDPKEVFGDAQRAIQARNVSALERLLRDHESVFRTENPPPCVPSGAAPNYTSGFRRIRDSLGPKNVVPAYQPEANIRGSRRPAWVRYQPTSALRATVDNLRLACQP